MKEKVKVLKQVIEDDKLYLDPNFEVYVKGEDAALMYIFNYGSLKSH